MTAELTGLGADGFEQMCQTLAVHVLGSGVVVFGDGPDGGREATFDGPLNAFPSPAQPWDGYVVLQAKFKSKPGSPGEGTAWLRERITAELEVWADPRGQRGRLPDYLIIATNVSLSSVAGAGGKDRIEELFRSYADRIGLKGWRVWDETQILTFLSAYPDVRKAFSTLTTSNEVFAALLASVERRQPRAERPAPPPRFRPGEPGNEAAFQEAYDAAGGAARLGHALGLAREAGPGWVQDFEGGRAGEPAVICALFGRPAVAVARAIWNEIARIGAGPDRGTTGVGYPVLDQSAPHGFIGSAAEVVAVAGGRWGRRHRGRLLRRPPHPPAWLPEIAFDSDASQDRDVWTCHIDPMDLRLRVAARLPLFADEWRITGSSRSRMITELANSGAADVVHTLTRRFDLDSSPAVWREISPPDGRNDSRCTAHELVVYATDGRPAVALCVRLTLPNALHSDLLAIVDLRIDFDAIRPGSAAQPAAIPTDLRITSAELTGFFARAWHVATMIVPRAATDDPLAAPPTGAPRLEFYIQSERPVTRPAPRTVRTLDMIDLDLLGAPRDSQVSDLAVAVTTPLGLPEDEINSLVHDAIQRIAEDYGFAAPTAS